MPDDIDAVIWAAKTSATFLQQIAATLAEYKATGQLPEDLGRMVAAAAGPKKRGPKKGKFNKDGTEKQPRKPTAYNAWMQAKLKELKEAADHDPNQKHVDTFKQAAHIWASMDPDEKKRITEEFKAKAKEAGIPTNGADAGDDDDEDNSSDEEDISAAAAHVVPAAAEESSEESEEEDEPGAKKPPPAPKPAPRPAPVPAPAQALQTPEKKKKKRKQEQAPTPASVKAELPTSPDGEKKKKKKKKAAAADQ